MPARGRSNVYEQIKISQIKLKAGGLETNKERRKCVCLNQGASSHTTIIWPSTTAPLGFIKKTVACIYARNFTA